jgi:hypothetical protein
MLDLGTRRRLVVSFTHWPLYPKERASGTHWIGGWVGPRAGLDTAVKRKIPSPWRDSNPRSSSPQPSTIPLGYPGTFFFFSEKEVVKLFTSSIRTTCPTHLIDLHLFTLTRVQLTKYSMSDFLWFFIISSLLAPHITSVCVPPSERYKFSHAYKTSSSLQTFHPYRKIDR